MPATLGPYTFASYQGNVPYPRRRSAQLPEQPGVDGIATAYGGWVVDPVDARTTTRLAGTILDAESVANNYRGSIGGAYTLVLPNTRALMVRVFNCEVADPMLTVDGAYLIACRWTLIPEASA